MIIFLLLIALAAFVATIIKLWRETPPPELWTKAQLAAIDGLRNVHKQPEAHRCKYCGEEFSAKNALQKYCFEHCNQNWAKQAVYRRNQKLKSAGIVFTAIFCVGLSSCSVLERIGVAAASGAISALSNKPSEVSGSYQNDTITVVRTYPSDYVNFRAKRDTLVVLKSGDVVRSVWQKDGSVSMLFEITPDTVKLARK